MYTVVYSKHVSMLLEAIKILLYSYTTALSAKLLFICMKLM